MLTVAAGFLLSVPFVLFSRRHYMNEASLIVLIVRDFAKRREIMYITRTRIVKLHVFVVGGFPGVVFSRMLYAWTHVRFLSRSVSHRLFERCSVALHRMLS